jgi:hypothetical protein
MLCPICKTVEMQLVHFVRNRLDSFGQKLPDAVYRCHRCCMDQHYLKPAVVAKIKPVVRPQLKQLTIFDVGR